MQTRMTDAGNYIL